MLPILRHRHCPDGGMIWDGDYCGCRYCGTGWKLTEWGWKVDGPTPKPKFRSKR